MIVVITDEAEEDFEHIGDYIAQYNPARAESFVDELLARCMRLSNMPLRFSFVPRFERTGVRRLPHGNYVIFYRVEDERVEILRILNGARDYEKLLFPDEDDF